MPHDPQRAFDSSEFVLDDSHYSAYRDYRKRMARDHPNISAMPAPEYFHTQTDGRTGLHPLYGTPIDSSSRESFWRQYFAELGIIDTSSAFS